MLAFILRRLGQAVIVLLTVALIAFSLFRFVGDPTNQLVSQDTTVEERLRIRKDLGLDDPFYMQFGRFVADAARFEFGRSYQVRQPVSKLIAERFRPRWSWRSSRRSSPFSLACQWGSIRASTRHRCWRACFQTISLVGISLPTFLIGILLIFVFSVSLGWLPSFGRQGVVNVGGWPRVS